MPSLESRHVDPRRPPNRRTPKRRSTSTTPSEVSAVRISRSRRSPLNILYFKGRFCPETRGKDEHRKSDDRRTLPGRTDQNTDRTERLGIPQKSTLTLPVPHLPGSYDAQSSCPHYTSSLLFEVVIDLDRVCECRCE